MWENLKIIMDLNKKLESIEGIEIPTVISLRKIDGQLAITLKILFPLGAESISPEEKNIQMEEKPT